MFTTQIQLSDDKIAALKNLSRQTGKSESELIGKAVDQLLESVPTNRRLEHLKQAKGMWKDHDSISAEQLRKNWDRM